MAIKYDKVKIDSDSPEPRCSCVLLLDTSGSMQGRSIEALNAGLKSFYEAIRTDELTVLRLELAIITFGPVHLLQDFSAIGEDEIPQLQASGDTPMGEALNLALDRIDVRKEVYKENAIPYFRPWVFLITDGAPTDIETWERSIQRLQFAENAKKVNFFAVGVENANMQALQRMSSICKPLKLEELKFREMFLWLSNSLSGVSRSQLGDEVDLRDPLVGSGNPGGWGKRGV
jgi:uncharacterized protein YegL